MIDTEVRRIVDECYDTAVITLKEHRPQLDALAAALLQKETLEEIEAYEIACIQRPSAAEQVVASSSALRLKA